MTDNRYGFRKVRFPLKYRLIRWLAGRDAILVNVEINGRWSALNHDGHQFCANCRFFLKPEDAVAHGWNGSYNNTEVR